ncbi:hypothetical protein AB4254_08240 [Vibrio breoganii]
MVYEAKNIEDKCFEFVGGSLNMPRTELDAIVISNGWLNSQAVIEKCTSHDVKSPAYQIAVPIGQSNVKMVYLFGQDGQLASMGSFV